MSRKAKITAVPVDTVAEGQCEQPHEVTDEKTDAERMTDVINVVKLDDEAPIAPSEPVVIKAKAKRASRAKVTKGPKEEEPKEEEPNEYVPQVEVVSSSLNEVQVEVTIPEEKQPGAKADAKVACPECGKQMSAKTLKYSHVPNCLAKKQSETNTFAPASHTTHLEDAIENEVQKRLQNKRSERSIRREEMVQKLMKNAFP